MPDAPVDPWWRRHPRIVDVAVAVVATSASVVGAPPSSGELGLPTADAPAAVVLLGAGGLALLARRSRPLVAWAVVAVVAAVAGWALDDPGRVLPLAAAALYAVARYAGRRPALLTTGATAVAAVVALSLGDELVAGSGGPRAYAAFAFCGLAAALGDAVRTNGLLLDDAVERARVAEASREAEAERRVVEERLRISRDLHDVVGHHLAVVNVQAGVAEHLWASDPAAAQEAVGQVRREAVTALRQTSRLVGLLRVPDETGQDGAATEPGPGLPELPALVDAIRAAGTDVRWVRRGPLVDDGWEGGRTVYRVVQEALTNAVRHGTGPVHLLTAVEDGRLRIGVRNRVRPAAVDGSGSPTDDPSSGGHGLVVMRERVLLAGGTLHASRVGEDFGVEVALPLGTGEDPT
jgi:signal transduction histidine kinase